MAAPYRGVTGRPGTDFHREHCLFIAHPSLHRLMHRHFEI